MAITNVQAMLSSHGTAIPGTPNTQAFASNVTANNTIFLFVRMTSTTALITKITDSQGNLYIPQHSPAVGGGVTIQRYFVPLIKTTGPCTVQVTIDTAVDIELVSSEWSFGAGNQPGPAYGAGASGYGLDTYQDNSGTAATGLNTGASGNTTVANEVWIGYIWTASVPTGGAAGWTTTLTNGAAGGGSIYGYKLVSATGNPQMGGCTQTSSAAYAGGMMAAAAIAIPTPYFIAPSPLGLADGSSAANAADASTAVKLAAIIASKNTQGQVINWAAGTYLTTGNLNMFSAITHQGPVAGPAAIVQMAAGTGNNTMWLNSNPFPFTATGFQMFNLTFDSNATASSWWNVSAGSSRTIATPDCSSWWVIKQCRFINWGAQGGNESFIIFFGDGQGQTLGMVNNNTVDSCVFTQPIAMGNGVGSGVSCVSCGNTNGGNSVDATNVVQNCQFLNFGQVGGYSDFTYTHCVGFPTVQNCLAVNCDTFFYMEPGDTPGQIVLPNITCSITGNTIMNSGEILSIKFAGNGTVACAINIANNTYKYGYQPYCVQVTSSFSGTDNLSAFTITNNIISFGNASSGPFLFAMPSVAPNLTVIPTLTITNNTMLNWPASTNWGDNNQSAVQYGAGSVTTYVHSGNRFITGSSYPQGIDQVVGSGIPGALLSTGGPVGESHTICHAEISAALAFLQQNAPANDSFLLQDHFDVTTVAATLVSGTPYGPNSIIPTFTGTGCSIVRAASVAGHKGIWTLTTGTVASNKPEVSQLPALKDIQTGFFGKLAFRAVVLTPGTLPSGNTTANAQWRIGLTDTLGSLTPVNCIEWVFNPNTNAFWSLVLTNASTVSTTASTITVAINTWYDLQIYQDANGVLGRVAAYQTLIPPHLVTSLPLTTNQPGSTTNMAWHVLAMNGASGTTSFALGLDLIEFVGQPNTIGVSSGYRGAGMLKSF